MSSQFPYINEEEYEWFQVYRTDHVNAGLDMVPKKYKTYRNARKQALLAGEKFVSLQACYRCEYRQYEFITKVKTICTYEQQTVI